MSKPTNFHVQVAIAVVIASILIARTKTIAASESTALAAGTDIPSVSYWHVWTDEKGVSHQQRSEWKDFKLQSISEGRHRHGSTD
jgi:hypothetical protein